MATDTAALTARLREYASEVLDARHDAEPPYSNEYECALAALDAADHIDGVVSETCGTSFMAGSVCTLWPDHYGSHEQRCHICGVDENAESHRPGCANGETDD